jgi:protein involved in polysaccharide export with SLBB domain
MRLAISILMCVGALLSARGQSVSASYQLSPMDKLSVSISQDPVTGRPVEVSVSPLGDLTVPVSRCCEDSITVNVRGKTVEEAEKEIKQRLEADFYEKATVQLRVIDPTRRKGQALLRGAVRQSSVQLDPGKPKTLYEALTEAGTTDYANLKKVKLDRVGSPIKYYDMTAVEKGDRSKDVELQDGDRITVEESFFKLR